MMISRHLVCSSSSLSPLTSRGHASTRNLPMGNLQHSFKLQAAPGDGKTADQATLVPEASSISSSAAASSSARRIEKQSTSARSFKPARSEPMSTSAASSASSFVVPLIVAASALAALVFMYRKFFTEQARSIFQGATLTMDRGMKSQTLLQKEGRQRLEDFCDRLRSLPSVDLSAQNLGDEGSAYVIEALAFNQACLSLELSKNGIGRVGVAALSQVLNSCSLKTLVLSTNSVGDEGSELLATALSGNSLMQKLELGQNGIGDRGACALAEALKLNTTLLRLDLSGNGIDVHGAKSLASALAVNSTLRILNLNDNYIGEEGALALAEALATNTSLREISLKGNEMGDSGVKAMCEALQGRACPLSCLDLGNNSITSGEGARAVASLLRIQTSITELVLYMNDLGDAGIGKVSESLPLVKGLKNLDVGGNNIGPEGVASLVSALKGHESLESLELGYNPLGPKGSRTLVEVAKFDLPRLETLKLGWCKLGVEGSRSISELLVMNSTLRSLDLRGNELGNDGAIILGRGLKSAGGGSPVGAAGEQQQQQQLKELDLGYNEIKDDGACAIAQALKANADGAPRELKLNSNYITRFGQVALTEAIDMVYEMSKGRTTTTVHF